ncbi:MAG TPA: pyridoxal-5'-phosphate-dependent protein subunit beta [Lentisphaeria bacterium]|nr:MAG: pyridoxal-5'-phosphate-dependent protein subunit beta [Lentisphaerae bacterium GWF2_38_69]HBM15504.1 pyridoxal-5'-phosphate-dependent protein subunit beta [Lentisphaeria bacterium]
MAKLGLECTVVNQDTLNQTVKKFKERKIQLPTYEELADPSKISPEIVKALENIDRDEAHPLNLYRINWYNDPNGKGFKEIPYYFEVPKALTGVDAKILVMPGAFFPMVNVHKVLAAYGCLAPRLITGQFDPNVHKAIWPSTGNYCRGGVAVSRIMGCRGVAILPEEMSEERFNWLNKWCLDPQTDIYKTYGCESNVKEIYDKCNELDKDSTNIIFNQFCEFGNTIIHYVCTGKALNTVYTDVKKKYPELKLKAFTSATGSAGTISAGDYLKDTYNDLKIVSVEALECPTLLYNGFGGHNIQGIGDKHVPFVHNVMNNDIVAAISDVSTDSLYVLFNSDAGKKYLKEVKGLTDNDLYNLSLMGLSSIANMLAAIKTAKYYHMNSNDAIITVATDPAFMYKSEGKKATGKYFNGKFNELLAAETFGQHLKAVTVDHFMEMTLVEKERVFNLGYYTWVEQQGVEIKDFNARKNQKFWQDLKKFVPIWDNLIREFNKLAK